MSPPVAPGLAATLYDGSADLRAAWAGAKALLTEARVPIVQLHATPSKSLAPVVAEIRAALPGVRTWVGVPGNTYVRDDGPTRIAKVTRTARDLGAECMVLNCERPSAPGNPGWVPTVALSAAELDARMRRVLAAIALELGDMVLGFTSHDMPQWHPIPWRAALGAESPVRLHLPQQYAAPPRSSSEPSLPPATSWRGAKNRAEASDTEWRKLARAGVVRADLAPGGDGFATYGQAHDIATAGVMLIADRTAVSALWALDGRTGLADRSKRPKCDALGALAIRALMHVRRAVGEGAGAGSIARWQAAHALEADGVAGAATFSALALPAPKLGLPPQRKGLAP